MSDNAAEQQGATGPSGKTNAAELTPRQKSNLNLLPFRPGHSGNPSGLTKDGKGVTSASLRAALLKRLGKPGSMDRLADKWYRYALQGSYPHLNGILERIWPKEDERQSGTVLEGIRLEMHEGGMTATLIRGEQAGQLPQLPAAQGLTINAALSPAPSELPAASSESDALSARSESQSVVTRRSPDALESRPESHESARSAGSADRDPSDKGE